MKIQQLRKYPKEIKAYNIDDLVAPTGNFYLAVAVIAKRANEVADKVSMDLQLRLEQFTLEPGEYDPREIEERTDIVSAFEHLPKPHVVAIEEYLEGRLGWKVGDEE